jgi:hypothetical protein
MPRFVILEHDFPETHWDLMLEAGAVLRTWRLPQVPETGKTLRAEASFDHRVIYLDYEGPISGNRGHVSRWDWGSFTLQFDSTDRIVLHFSGQRLQGTAELVRDIDGSWSLFISQ